MRDIIVRKAVPKDLKVLLGFEQGIIKAERPFDETLANDPISYYNLEKLIQNNNAAVYVAEIEDQLVASGYAVIKTAKPYLNHKLYSYLGFMYTDSKYRGKGINAKIIEALKAWSHSRGIKEIRLQVYSGNLNAIKAYAKVGFKEYLVEMRLS